METVMEMKNRASDRSLSERWQSCTPVERSEALVARLARFYSVMGHRPDEPGALAMMADILCQSASDEQIAHAMTRCSRECHYPVRLPDFLQRIPGQEIPETEAEGRKAWDLVTSFASKWVQSDPEGKYVITRGVRSSDPPKLSDRILDTVRRTGGWKVYVCMSDEDFPFVQKRFFDEYKAWIAVEGVELPKLIQGMPLRLVAKPMDAPKIRAPKQEPTAVPAFNAKVVPIQMTDTQLRDRREMLRQQSARLLHERNSQ
jgi:hypothetical protein